MKEVAGMLKRRFANIVTYLKHRITNATSESINAKIQWVKYTARGYRNKQNFINAIYFHCGGLDLAPAATKGLLNNNLYKTEVMRYVVGSGPPFQSGCQAGRR